MLKFEVPKSAERTVEEQPGKMSAVVLQAPAQTAFCRCEVMSMVINILRHTCQIVLEFSSETQPCVNVKGKKIRKIFILWFDDGQCSSQTVTSLPCLAVMSTGCHLCPLLEAH